MFVKGQSGNPKGKPIGAVGKATKLRQSIEKDLPGIIAAMVQQAQAGDVQAARLLMERTVPAIKPQDTAVRLPLAGVDLGADGRAIMTAVGAGDATPEVGAKLLAGLSSLARVIEVGEIMKRVEALEAANANQNKA